MFGDVPLCNIFHPAIRCNERMREFYLSHDDGTTTLYYRFCALICCIMTTFAIINRLHFVAGSLGSRSFWSGRVLLEKEMFKRHAEAS